MLIKNIFHIKKNTDFYTQFLYRFFIGWCILLSFSTVGFAMSPQHKNMLFYHSFFQNRHWGRTADTITYELSPEFTALKITNVSMVGNDSSNIAVFTTTAGDLYFMRCVVEPPLSIVSRTKIKTDPPVKSSLGSAASLFTAFPISKNNSDTLFLAIAGLTNNIAIHRIETNNFTVLSIDTLRITPPAGVYKTTKLMGNTEYTGTIRSSLWVGGSYGAIRLFSWNGSTWSGETVFDIETTETVSAMCNTAVGTESGKIYEWSNNKFIFNAQPCSTAINYITANGAVGNSGVVIKKNMTNWVRFTAGSAHYRYFNFISRTNGTGVELLSGSLIYSVQTLEDSPTLLTVEPDNIGKYLNNGVYQYGDMGPESLTVRLNDPDKNCAVPSILINNSIDLTNNGTYKLHNMHPDTACIPGFVEIADTSIVIILKSSSVTISARARTAQYNDISDRYHWKYFTFTSTRNWNKYNVMQIKSGTNSLVIRYGMSHTTISQNTNLNPKNSIVFQRIQKGLHFSIPLNTINFIRIVNLQGQQLAFTKILPSQDKVVLPGQTSSGIICIECSLKDGSFKRYMLPLVKTNGIFKF